MQGVNCGNCEHFARYLNDADEPVNEGRCRRYPPRVFRRSNQAGDAANHPDGPAVTVWPSVIDTDLCGEWAPIPLGVGRDGG